MRWCTWSSGMLAPYTARPALSSVREIVPLPSTSMVANISWSPLISSSERQVEISCRGGGGEGESEGEQGGGTERASRGVL